MKTANEVVQYFENLYTNKAIYVWGSNGQIITKELCDRLFKAYGNKTYTQEYYNNKFLEGAGQIGADCSGAFYPVSGLDKTAQGYYNACSVKGHINYIDKAMPCLVFKGASPVSINHIGFYCGNGYVIEMKSSKDNCTKSKLESGKWSFFGIPKWIDYGNSNNITFGVDLSACQTRVDFNALKSQGYKFVILRSIVKSGALDDKFQKYYAEAKKAGLKIGVYILTYALSEVDAITSAQRIIAILKGDIVPIFLDLETDGGQLGKIGKAGINRVAKAFLQTCNQYGYSCYIYCNTDWYKNVLDQSLRSKAIWIARYGKNNGTYDVNYKPNIGEKIWQYTSRGQISGISSGDHNYVDVDACYDMSIFGSTPTVNKAVPSYTVTKMNVIGVVTGDSLRIRQEPNTDAAVVGSYNKGDNVSLIGKTSNGWYKTNKGYIHGDYVKYLEGKITNCNKVNVRMGASKLTPSVKVLIAADNDQFYIISGMGDWFNVLLKDNTVGWIKKDYVELIV